MSQLLKAAVLAQSIFWAGALSANTFIMTDAEDQKVFSTRGVETVSEIVNTYNDWKQYSNYLGKTEQWVWSSENSQNVYWYDVDGNYQLLVNFSDPVGTEYNVNVDGCTNKAVLTSKNVSTSVAAGQFDNAIRLTFSGLCADGGMLEAVFAPGVGLVSYAEQSIAGPVVSEMVSGTVQEVTYPMFSGIEMRAEFPAGRIMSNEQNKVSAYITLENRSSREETFTFPSSQLFDIEIIDAKGEVVNVWSANKRFMMAIQEVKIPAGGSQRFGGAIELRNFEGQTLDVGSYRVRIVLKGSNQPVASVYTAVPYAAESPLYIDQRITLDY